MTTDRDSVSSGAPPGGRDPRQFVTPYAFRVADELMGERLATPWRRAGAMLVDLVAVLGIVVVREIAGPLFLLLLAWFAYRATTDRARNPVRGTVGRVTLRAVAVVLLMVSVGRGMEVVTGGIDSPGEGPDGEGGSPGAVLEESAASRGAHIGLTDLPGVVRGLSDLRSGDTARARVAAEQLARKLRTAGMTRAEIREVLRTADEPRSDTTLRVAYRRALAGLDSAAAPGGDSARRARGDSLARSWVTSLEAGDTASADSARRGLAGLLAADTVAPLRRRVDALGSTLRLMEERLEEAEDPPGLLDYLEGIARDLGFGLGSLGLYFTAFLALWNGHTPGKRLLGIRVAKVNGEPLGWWDAFSRFGGYAASFVTGLVGFLQIAWDANRQGLHDRIAGTVVLREQGEKGERAGQEEEDEEDEEGERSGRLDQGGDEGDTGEDEA